MSIRYSEDFKLAVVREYENGHKSNSLIATEYGIAKSTVMSWVRQYSKECPHLKSYTTNIRSNSKKIQNLQRRITELEKENEFLKKASAFFIVEID